MATFRIVVVVDSSGARRGSRDVERQLNKTNDAANRLRQTLGRAFTFGAIALGVREIIRLGDTFTNLQNRIRVVTKDQAQLAVVTEELFGVAERTRSSFEGTADLYARVALASRELGVSQRELIQFTESVNKAIILSGASAREANAGLIQLSQGLASGTLRGDELRSVLEQLPVVADVIADRLGVTRGALRRLGSEGKITADIVLAAFRDAREEIAEKFANTIPTIGQSFEVLRTQVIKFIGAVDQSNGVLQSLSTIILGVAANFELFVRIVGVAAITLGIKFGVRAIGAAIAGLRALAVAIVTNPFGAFATLVTIAIAALLSFGDQIRLSANSSITAFDFIRGAARVALRAVEDAFKFVSTAIGGFDVDLSNIDFLTVLLKAAQFGDALVGIFVGAFNTIGEFSTNFASEFEGVFVGLLNFVTPGANPFTRNIATSGRSLGAILDENLGQGLFEGGAITAAVKEAIKEAETIARVREEADARRARERARALEELEEPVGAKVPVPDPNFVDAIAKLTREQAFLTKTLEATNREFVIEQGLLKIANKLKDDLTVAQEAQARSLLEENQALMAQRDLFQSIRSPLDSLIERKGALKTLFDSGKISLVEFNTEMRNLNVQVTALDNSISGGLLNGLARIAQEANNVGASVSEFIVDTFDRATDAIIEFAKTGRLNIKQFFQDIFANLARLALNQVFASLAGGLFGALGGGGGIFGSLFGGLPGFASGGSFEVNSGTSLASIPGEDNRLVGFRARDGETVTVTRPGQQTGNGGGRMVNNNITLNIQTSDADSFNENQGQILAKMQAALNRADRRNN